MKVFKVVRNKEGGSKYEVGHLIDGVEFDDGTVVIRWRSDIGSTAIYKCWDDFYKIHIGDHQEYNAELIWKRVKL